MPENDPSAAIRTPLGAAPASGGLPGESPPFPVPDHTLIRRVGRGAYGEVWLARNTLGTWRAVKFIRRSSFDDDRPFEREFAGIQRFEPISRSHESQLNILHVGRAEDGFYYVMELADDMGRGQDIDEATYTPRNLRSELHLRGRLPAAECLRLGLALTTALEHLHKHGLVHRDIKPSNIVFVNGIPKLADIGLVARAEATISFVGTEGFLPPEGPGTRQADIYSLGKVLYELSTGHDRNQFPELPTNIVELPDRAELSELNEVLLKACHRDPKERYQTSAEMHADLALLESGRSVVQMRGLERRLRSLARAGAVVTAIAVIAGLGFFYQRLQTREARRLADENRALAGEKSRLADEKSKLADENRERLIRLRVARGVALMEQGDFSQALLWFAETLPLVEHDPELSRIHRLRLQSVLDYTPPLRQVFRHTAFVRDCRFSPDGQWLATGSDDRTARVWSVATGEPVSPPLTHATNVHSVSFSTNGQQLATWSADGHLKLWSAADAWRPVLSLSNLAAANFSIDRELILVAQVNGQVEIRDHTTGAIVGKPFSVEGRPSVVSISPDGRTLAVACEDKAIRFYSREDGSLLPHKLVLDEPILLLLYSKDGHRLLVLTRTFARDNGLRLWLWDPVDGRRIVGPLPPRSGNLTQARFLPDGKSVLVSSDTFVSYRTSGALELWDAETGEFVRTLAANISATDARLSPAGDLLAWCSRGGETRLLDFESARDLLPPLHHGDCIFSLAFNLDGSALATCDFSGIVKVWSLKTPAASYPRVGQATNEPARNPEMVIARFSSEGNKLITATARRARVWDTADWKLLGDYAPPTGYEVCSVLWEREHTNFICALVGPTYSRFHVRLAYPETRQLGPPLISENNNGSPMSSVGGSFLVTTEIVTNGGPYFLHVWRTASGEEAFPRIQLPALPRVVRWGADNRLLASGGREGTTHIWEVSSGREVLPALKQDEAVSGAEFSHDGRRLATGSLTKGARIWELGTGRLLTPPLNHPGVLDWTAWSPDDRSLLTCGQGFAIRQWDTATGQPNVPPMEHANALTCARYTHDGRLILSSSLDGTARVWSSLTGEPAIVPVPHGQRVNNVFADPADHNLVTLTRDGAIRAVPLRTLDFSASAILDYAHALTSKELDRFETAQPIDAIRVAKSFQDLKANHPNFPAR